MKQEILILPPAGFREQTNRSITLVFANRDASCDQISAKCIQNPFPHVFSQGSRFNRMKLVKQPVRRLTTKYSHKKQKSGWTAGVRLHCPTNDNNHKSECREEKTKEIKGNESRKRSPQISHICTFPTSVN